MKVEDRNPWSYSGWVMRCVYDTMWPGIYFIVDCVAVHLSTFATKFNGKIRWNQSQIIPGERFLWCYDTFPSNKIVFFVRVKVTTILSFQMEFNCAHIYTLVYKIGNKSLSQVIYQSLFAINLFEITIFHINKFPKVYLRKWPLFSISSRMTLIKNLFYIRWLFELYQCL